MKKILSVCSILIYLAIGCSNTKEVVTATAIPTTKPLIIAKTPTIEPTPTTTPTQIISGKINPGEIEEYFYTPLKKDTMFPAFDINFAASTNEEVAKIISTMYKDSEVLEDGGIRIYTPLEDIIEIGTSSINEGVLSYSFYKNGKKTATITGPPGVLYDFVSKPEQLGYEYSLSWCFYVADMDSCVNIITNYERNIYYVPAARLEILVDEEWIPHITERSHQICEPSFNRLLDSYVDDENLQSEEEEERLKSLLTTWGLAEKNEEEYIIKSIFHFGPPPLPCPNVEITYP